MSTAFVAKYLDTFIKKDLPKSSSQDRGIVVTVSRDTGCHGSSIVEETVKELNAQVKSTSDTPPWQILSKELLGKSAKALNLKPSAFESLENAKGKNFVEDILDSFSNENNPSDIKIKGIHKKLIESLSRRGNVIILGRAGVAIHKNNIRAVHIKLAAPLEWRIKNSAKEQNITEVEARKRIQESDTSRSDLKRYYMRRTLHYTDYDVILNVSSLTKKEICSCLVSIIEQKGN